MPPMDQHGDAPPDHARAVLAHEVRGALTVITGFAEMLKRDLDPDDCERALSAIQRAVSRIDRLMDSSMGARADDADIGRIRLRALAERVAEDQRAITGRSIEVTGSGDPLVSVEPEALERALGNLIDNALKYSLGNSAVEVSVTTERNSAVLEVSDRGPGVPADHHERVFEPFERLGESGAPGTGLGLTVVRSIAESHGGSAVLADRSGGGSTFTIKLPLAG